MKTREIIENLTEDILTYVMHGSISDDLVAEKLKAENLDERFNDYKNLMDLHFILQDEMVKFVEKLPRRLRSIKTQTKNISSLKKGKVDGKIDWQSTIRHRYSRNPDNNSLFVCNNRTENYDIDENLVLKKLLSVVNKCFNYWEEPIKKDYGWLKESWKENDDLISEMRDILDRNVHINRIRKPQEYEPTDRMIQRAKKSRKEIYQEAASLLEKRNKMQKGDKEVLKEILERTSITPDDKGTLYELFILFRYIDSLTELLDSNIKLSPIESENQEVARLDSDRFEVILYHDQSSKKLSFKTDVAEKEDSELSRSEIVQKRAVEVYSNYFNKPNRGHTGRPDIIVLEVKDKKVEEYKYLITEVKNSTSQKTIRNGIKEALEYLAFLKVENEEYIFEEEEFKFLGNGWNGVLAIQDLNDQNYVAFENQKEQPIKILQAEDFLRDESGEVKEPMKMVLGKMFL